MNSEPHFHQFLKGFYQEMCLNYNNVLCSLRHHHLIIYVLVLLISSSIKDRVVIEGRKLATSGGFSDEAVKDEKVILKGQIGSRPPRCDRRCSSCGHCEAIQVPTNRNISNGGKNSTAVSTVTYARGDDNSNYKPMSWKCKCGSIIFNP